MIPILEIAHELAADPLWTVVPKLALAKRLVAALYALWTNNSIEQVSLLKPLSHLVLRQFFLFLGWLPSFHRIGA